MKNLMIFIFALLIATSFVNAERLCKLVDKELVCTGEEEKNWFDSIKSFSEKNPVIFWISLAVTLCIIYLLVNFIMENKQTDRYVDTVAKFLLIILSAIIIFFLVSR